MFTIISQAFNRTAQNWKMVLTVFFINLLLGLILARPAYTTLKSESQQSLEFDKLVPDFDFTVLIDFLNKSSTALTPFWTLGIILSLVYLILNVFFAGGILTQFAQRGTFRLMDFFKNSAQYFGKFLLVFLLEVAVILAILIFSIILLGIFIIAADGSTEPMYMAWLTPPFLIIGFLLTVVLNIGNYAKVILFKNITLNAWDGFWKATNYIFQNFKTMRIYWAIILIAVIFLLVYLFLESAIGMTSGFKIFIMFIIQQVFIFGRVFLKMWTLSGAFEYLSLKPIPIPIQPQVQVIEGDDDSENIENKLSE